MAWTLDELLWTLGWSFYGAGVVLIVIWIRFNIGARRRGLEIYNSTEIALTIGMAIAGVGGLACPIGSRWLS